MGNLTERLAEALNNMDVTESPRRVAQGAMLLETVQEHEQRSERLASQVEQFLAGESNATSNGHKSLADWAYEVLSDHPGPMRYREIAAEIRGRGFQHAREPKYGDAQLPDSVWSAMHEDSQKRFVKVGRGIWDLRERRGTNGN